MRSTFSLCKVRLGYLQLAPAVLQQIYAEKGQIMGSV